ncbi:HET-C-related protein [Flavobacterium ardleyense]|uniref:HET-C-related protein n=1 Tax=Flavobacterium ardleyense TaxID=2038737 RepID=A0ABW5Z5Y8_9FLAO
MGITKQAKNIAIYAKTEYIVRAKELEELADKVNYEAQKDNLVLTSSKRVDLKGEEGGVKRDTYSPEELVIEESEFLLESKFALEQLFAFAEKDSKAMFCSWMASIFGEDIPLKAYEKLYQDASNKKESIKPKITVALGLDVPGYGATYYTGKNKKFKNHVIISEGFITNALKDNVYQKLLLIALVEEFGHHLDYLLRNEYSSKGGDAKKDEGAIFSGRMNRKYKKYYIDPVQVKEQHYATATIEGAEKELIWDFEDLHVKLKEFVDNREEKDDHYYAGYEFFGAGIGDTMHGLGHQHIENVALGKIKRYEDDDKGVNAERAQIYFGNWLRDFSQFVDPMIVRPTANAMAMMSDEYDIKIRTSEERKILLSDLSKILETNSGNSNTYRIYALPYLKYTTNKYLFYGIIPTSAAIDFSFTAMSPVQLSREAVTSLVELIAVKEFGNKQIKDDEADNKTQNYFKYLKTFREQYAPITTDLLGVYRPEEHIDNPAALHYTLICEEIDEKNKKKGTNKPHPPKNFNHDLDEAFVKDPVEEQWGGLEGKTGIINYVRGFKGNDPFESAFSCFLRFIDASDPETPKGLINFGAALHILEDYFAHSNFTEIAIMKVYDPEVFPWNNMDSTFVTGQLKKHKANSASNSFEQHAKIDVTKAQFRTLENPDLWTNAVKNFMVKYKDKLPSQKTIITEGLDGRKTYTFPPLMQKIRMADEKTHPSDYYKSLGNENPYDNKGLYYAAAACTYIQTGSFGMLDTMASITPKIIQKIFDKEQDNEQSLKFGERTFNDALIYEMLKDISNAQEADSKEKILKYKGKDDNLYSDAFLNYLNIRDYINSYDYIKDKLKDLMNSTGMLDYITDYVDVIENTLKHYMWLQGIGLIDDFQTYQDNQLTLLEEGNWKVRKYGPTHTQLAKDSALHPLHPLAVKLAEVAVHEVGKLFVKKDFKGIKDLADKFLFQHPMYTSWMDEQVIDWCKNNKTPVLLARQPSIVLLGIRHGFEEMASLYEQLSKMRNYEVTIQIEETFESLYSLIPKKWNEGWERLNKLYAAQGLETLKIKKAHQKAVDFMKTVSHGHEHKPQPFSKHNKGK